MKAFGALTVAFLAVGFAALQPAKVAPQVTNHEAEGNVQATQPVACVGLAELTNRLTPADIFPGVLECIDTGDYDKAADLFAVAGLYGHFDMLRVADRTAHQAITVLQINYLGSLEQARLESFQETVKARLRAGSSHLVDICDHVKKMGAPEYHPGYMIQHGIGAFSEPVEGIKSDFDAAEAWAASLDGYLHCPM